ncbi:alpha/beta hydrolase [Opitutia bacterium ISCC 51]|nr:alpha/beta hydrolase [Opitutae bacterium ISCC 51]QXD29809.1 alpha/beta hydrolase [Opitutae bacterium ISCC 52]
MKRLLPILLSLIVFTSLQAQRSRGPAIPEGVKVTKDNVYQTVNGRELPLDLYVPEGATEPLPLIIWIHGGGWRGGSKNGIQRCAEVLKHGYALASVEYRLSGEAIFPAAIEDCKAAISYLRWKAPKLGIDPDRFGVWGSSAGGHLVALLGTTNDVLEFDTHSVTKMASPTVQAVCNWFGPTDFLRMNDVTGGIDHDAADSPESLFMGFPIQDHPEKVQRANPITYVSPSDPPMLLMHGDNDQSVIYNQSELLYRALQKAGVDSELYKVKNGGHGFRGADESPESLAARAIDFFDKQLKD